MRPWLKILVGTLLVAAAAVAAPEPSHAQACSVFARHPCIYRPFHQVCSVFRRRPCVPELEYPFTEQLQLTIKRNGELFGKPRVTYVTPGLPGEVRQAYWDAVEAAVERCTPLALSNGLGGALAGRPFAIRFVDQRSAS